MKSTLSYFVGIVVIIGIIAILNGFYTVPMHEQVIITQFQKPIGKPIAKPGLHWKLPFIRKANYFDKRWLEWDGDQNQIPTLDKKYIWVDTYARWRIEDPLLFFQRVRNERGAQSRLDDILDGETRISIAKYKLLEVVRSTNREFHIPEEMGELEEFLVEAKTIKHGRNHITAEILEKAKKEAKEYGIDLVDIRIKRINYIPQVRKKVYERMISERKRIAEKYRSEGKGESEKILGDMEKELLRIRSEAVKKAQEIKGEGDAKATKIYAQAYNQDPDFYSFWKTMDVFRNTVDTNTWLLLNTDGEFYKYMSHIEE